MNSEMQHGSDFTLERDVWGQLVLVEATGRRLVGVEAARAFPISSPDEYISLSDAEGHEVRCIEDPRTLPREVLEILNEELTRREFVPLVERIESVQAEVDPSQWSIVTDRGPTTFLMEDSDNDVRRLGPYRILLVDTHGVRYLISDTRKLDGTSRRILDRYL